MKPSRSLLDNLQKRIIFVLKTTIFLQSQTDQHKADTPTSTRGLESFGISLSQLPKIFDMLRGLGRPHAAYTVAQAISIKQQLKIDVVLFYFHDRINTVDYLASFFSQDYPL